MCKLIENFFICKNKKLFYLQFQTREINAGFTITSGEKFIYVTVWSQSPEYSCLEIRAITEWVPRLSLNC